MKKLIIFFIVLFTMNANASWLPLEFIGVEQTGGFKLSHSKKQCEIDNPSKTSECLLVSGRYNYRYFKSFDVMKDDILNPSYEAKSSVVSCTDEADCIDKEQAQVCPISDSSYPYQVIRLQDNTEVYCTRIVSFPQIPTGEKHIAVDQTLKDAHDASELIKKAEDDAISSKIKDMDYGKRLYAIVQIKNKMKGLSKGQRRTLRTNLFAIKEDLMDGNICDARVDIAALTADGTLIIASDITEILSKIDGYKTCI